MVAGADEQPLTVDCASPILLQLVIANDGARTTGELACWN